MGKPERQQTILDLLKNLKGLEPLKQLFWSELNYERVNQPLSRRGWSDAASTGLTDDPVLFASGGQDNEFHVIYARLTTDGLRLGLERPVVSKLLQDHPYALFVFSDKSQNRWHFLNVKYDEQSTKRRLFRRITVGPEERLRTASERISLLDLSTISPDLFGLSPLTIQSAHDSAFDVEAVTKQFFEEYKAVYRILEEDLKRQTRDGRWAHDYALQFLNRIMFLYFVQRKRWLGDDTEFLRSFWEAYRGSKQTNDSFFDRWLRVLFFEAFNNKFHGGHRHFPEKIRNALSMAPYLNGGLFKDNELDDRNFTITDTQFQQVFKFLERYNFTIAEDSPIDQEVAVDPEMIGKVYESLVNVSTNADERGDAGIFYTPRTEIDLMCRLSLVDYLTNHLGSEHKNLLYEVVFAMDQEEKASADKAVAKAGLWSKISVLLREIAALDPACGSGSFIVGMLHILDDLQKRANLHLGIEETGFDRKKRIIGQSLYGVDVMEWACHVAELRLWLALVIDAEFTREELHIRKEPLLPHFTFKIRCGDSLVQEVGGINFGHIHASKGLSGDLKARITNLKKEKVKYYSNDPSCEFRSDKALKHAELKLFKDILATQALRKQEKIKELIFKIERPEWKAVSLLDGTVEQKPEQLKLEAITFQKEIAELSLELDSINHAQSALKNVSDIPFIWDIAFVEVFEGEKDGFDIVIGNPPYVRQENISDPHLSRDEVTTENKKEYKAKLMRSVYQAFDRFFGYKAKNDSDPLKPEKAVVKKIDAKSDLYIYFYFHGLSLLNSKGSFCFITSNSWLDVGYGADLQEFLLKHCQVKMVIDNQMKRSFASADVNTVIAFFSAPDETKEWGLNKTARFVMFKVPFEHILSAVIFEEIESQSLCETTKEYRVYPLLQKALFKEGCDTPEDDADNSPTLKKGGKGGFSGKVQSSIALIKSAKYTGNKWGGKYLRAPDIFFTILEKGKGKLVRLNDIAEVKYGIKTGANEFFYLGKDSIQKWGIEDEFIEPVIKSPRECKSILVNPEDLKFKIFMCHKDKKDLIGTNALKYIKWGEASRKDEDGKEIGQFHKRASCKGRPRWWECSDIDGNLFWGKEIRERIGVFVSNEPMYADCRLYFANTDNLIGASLNSTLTAFFSEVSARDLGGGGGPRSMMVYEVQDLLTLTPEVLSNKKKALSSCFANLYNREIRSIFTEIGINPSLPIREQIPNPLPDRKALDDIVFDILGLTEDEQSEVYWSVCELVSQRLDKARSL